MDDYNKLGVVIKRMIELKREMDEGDDSITVREHYKCKAEYARSICNKLDRILQECERRAADQIAVLADEDL